MTLSPAYSDPAVLYVAGEIDMSNADRLRARLGGLVSDGQHHRLVVNLADVSFCDASGLSAFLAGLGAVQQRGGWLRLCGMQRMVGKVFRVTALDRMFTIYPTLEQAVNDGQVHKTTLASAEPVAIAFARY